MLVPDKNATEQTMIRQRRCGGPMAGLLIALASALMIGSAPGMARGADAAPVAWRAEWPRTDFNTAAVAFDEIISGGPPKDGIPAIDAPRFRSVAAIADSLPDIEPVITLVIGDDARAYPLRILVWHEIVNDTVGGVPVAVTFCPLCNAALVFDRRIDGGPDGPTALTFGTTGKLRHSDLVMYDRQTESWWQQFLGAAIVGTLTGTRLRLLPVRIESYGRMKQRLAGRRDGVRVLVPADAGRRAYGRNPYVGYDGAQAPFLYRGPYDRPIPPLARVVVVDGMAWALDLLRARRTIRAGDLRLGWTPGQASALDTGVIADGRDVGNVVVQRRTAAGWTDAVYDVSFAFAFHAFHPDGTLHRLPAAGR